MNITEKWTLKSNDQSKYVGILEFQDDTGEWHNFEVVDNKHSLSFGGMCNVGFLESGYIVKEEWEGLDETLAELYEDLQTYYNNGKEYTSRIIFNERM